MDWNGRLLCTPYIHFLETFSYFHVIDRQIASNYWIYSVLQILSQSCTNRSRRGSVAGRFGVFASVDESGVNTSQGNKQFGLYREDKDKDLFTVASWTWIYIGLWWGALLLIDQIQCSVTIASRFIKYIDVCRWVWILCWINHCGFHVFFFFFFPLVFIITVSQFPTFMGMSLFHTGWHELSDSSAWKFLPFWYQGRIQCQEPHQRHEGMQFHPYRIHT